MAKEERDKYIQQLEEKAYATAEPWQRPVKPAEMPGFGGALAEAGMRMIGAPQQLVANILANVPRGREKGEEWWHPAVQPLEKTYRYLTGAEEKPTELPGGEFSRTLTDPWMWTSLGGAGLALALKGKTASEIVNLASRSPWLRSAIERLPGMGPTKKMIESGTRMVRPEALSRAPGALIPKYTELQPQRQTLYREVMKSPAVQRGVPKTLKPEYARTFVSSRGPQQKMMRKMIATPRGQTRMEGWLEQPPHLRTQPKGAPINEWGGRTAYRTEFGARPKSVVEEMTQTTEWAAEPGQTASIYESLEGQVSGAARARDEALNLPPVIQKKVKKVPKPPKAKKE